MLASASALHVCACKSFLSFSALDDVRAIAASACFRTAPSTRPAVQLRRSRRPWAQDGLSGSAAFGLSVSQGSAVDGVSLTDSPFKPAQPFEPDYASLP